jgi:hypothetical protein
MGDSCRNGRLAAFRARHAASDVGEVEVTLEPGIRTWGVVFIGIVVRQARDVSRGLDPLADRD